MNRFLAGYLRWIICCWLMLMVGRVAGADLESKWVSDFKRFLQKQDSEFVLVFSVTSSPNQALSDKLDEMNRGGRMKFKVDSGSTKYFYVRRSHSGFSVREASDVERLLGGEGRERGMISNVFYTVLEQGTTIDESVSARLRKQGRVWTELADESVQEALTLGLWIRPGSILWSGDTFAAETATCSPVPKDKRGKRLVWGELFRSNGIPVSVTYQYGSNRFTVRYAYGKSPSDSMELPQQVDILEQYLAGGTTSAHVIELIKYVPTNFPPGALALPQAKAETPVFRISRDGVGRWTNLKGHGSKPAVVKRTGSSVGKWVVLGGAGASTVLLLAWLAIQKRQSH